MKVLWFELRASHFEVHPQSDMFSSFSLELALDCNPLNYASLIAGIRGAHEDTELVG
jgi:hypothetical protein